jgi:hypothetical protein
MASAKHINNCQGCEDQSAKNRLQICVECEEAYCPDCIGDHQRDEHSNSVSTMMSHKEFEKRGTSSGATHKSSKSSSSGPELSIPAKAAMQAMGLRLTQGVQKQLASVVMGMEEGQTRDVLAVFMNSKAAPALISFMMGKLLTAAKDLLPATVSGYSDVLAEQMVTMGEAQAVLAGTDIIMPTLFQLVGSIDLPKMLATSPVEASTAPIEVVPPEAPKKRTRKPKTAT